MEIKDFVKSTLKQLSEALEETKTETGKRVSLTNTVLRAKQVGNYGLIDFDLAVEALSSETTGKGGGVRISVVEARLGKDKEISSTSISRIKFTIEANF